VRCGWEKEKAKKNKERQMGKKQSRALFFFALSFFVFFFPIFLSSLFPIYLNL
jgi:hypothetical protein